MYNFQSGFRPNQSANLYLADLTDKILKRIWWRLANWNDTYLSSKSIWHNQYEVLLQKLKAIRFSEQSIQWFRSYLCDWIFLVETENKLSDFWKVSCRVTQVSFLGPLLFLILCQWYASSSKIKFSLVCWWLMSYVPI